VYAAGKKAVFVTNNKDAIPIARQLRSARVVFLAVKEPFAVEAMQRALDWMGGNGFPSGRVLKVYRHSPLQLMSPLPF
jgi:hypothetical protein